MKTENEREIRWLSRSLSVLLFGSGVMFMLFLGVITAMLIRSRTPPTISQGIGLTLLATYAAGLASCGVGIWLRRRFACGVGMALLVPQIPIYTSDHFIYWVHAPVQFDFCAGDRFDLFLNLHTAMQISGESPDGVFRIGINLAALIALILLHELHGRLAASAASSD